MKNMTKGQLEALILNIQLERREIIGFVLEAGEYITETDLKKLNSLLGDYNDTMSVARKLIDKHDIAAEKLKAKLMRPQVKIGVRHILERPIITK